MKAASVSVGPAALHPARLWHATAPGPHDADVQGHRRAVPARARGTLSLNRPLNVHPFTALLTDEHFDHARATESVHRSAMRTLGATDFHRRQFHQPCAGASAWNRI